MSEPALPTEEDIAKLPRWARVAFAARCARRVLPLFRHYWPDAPQGFAEVVARAVECAERAASGDVFVRAAASSIFDETRFVIAQARKTARDVTATAYYAVDTAAAYDQDTYVVGAVTNILSDAARVIGTNVPLRADFDHLAALARTESWTDDTPIPPEVFGPMWPDGPPPGWPVESNAVESLVLLAPPQLAAEPDPLAGTRDQTPEDRDRIAAGAGFRQPRKIGDRVPHAEMWELVKQLGTGGFAEVWQARHRVTGEERAVKFSTNAALSDRLHELARHEANVGEHVQTHTGGHPHIVALLDCNLSGDSPWLMYALVPGGCSVADFIEELQAAPVPDRIARALPLMHAIAQTVGTLHRLARKIVHRDLTPKNVLLDNGVPRITDFGIGGASVEAALAGDTGGRSDGTVWVPAVLRAAVTPLHASPQQVAGAVPDPRDDVYALGVMLYQMLTGDRRALGGGAQFALESLGVPAPLVKLIVRSVADPEYRPADGAAFADALAPLLPCASAAPVPVTRRVEVPGLWYSRPAADPNAEWERLGFSGREITFHPDREYKLTVDIHARDSDLSGLSTLAGAPATLHLDLSGCDEVTASALAPLAQITGLRKLDIASVTISGENIAHIASLTGLQSLTFPTKSLTDQGLAFLASMTNLRSLSLWNMNETRQASLQHIAGLTNLRHLIISMFMRLTDAGLSHLSRLTNLESLQLGGAGQLTGEGFDHLRALTALRSLDLSFCLSLTDGGLAGLTELPLESLSLVHCGEITDEGLKHLARMSTLQDLNLEGCNRISEVGRVWLQQALPDCTIHERR